MVLMLDCYHKAFFVASTAHELAAQPPLLHMAEHGGDLLKGFRKRCVMDES
jgi:hypothetical protein